MKLVLAIVNEHDGAKVLEELNYQSFYVTKLATTGGFLRVGNMTLIIGTDEDKIEQVFEIIRNNCKKRKQVVAATAGIEAIGALTQTAEIDVGGATVFVMDVERFERL